MPSILPCSQCGGQGCYHCANEALDPIKAIERRSRFTSDVETERRAMTVSILTELAVTRLTRIIPILPLRYG